MVVTSGMSGVVNGQAMASVSYLSAACVRARAYARARIGGSLNHPMRGRYLWRSVRHLINL